MFTLKRKITNYSSILCLIFLLLITNFSAKSIATESPALNFEAQGLSGSQFYEITLSNETKSSFGIGEEIAVINQTAFYLKITVLSKSNGSVYFSPRFLDFDPVPESFTLGPGEANVRNYTWVGISPDDEKAHLKFDFYVITGTNATIRFEYAFLRGLTATSPSFSSMFCLIIIGTVFFWKRTALSKKRG